MCSLYMMAVMSMVLWQETLVAEANHLALRHGARAPRLVNSRPRFMPYSRPVPPMAASSAANPSMANNFRAAPVLRYQFSVSATWWVCVATSFHGFMVSNILACRLFSNSTLTTITRSNLGVQPSWQDCLAVCGCVCVHVCM